ncbi:uncharacterized protein [Apostichopus japonicus]
MGASESREDSHNKLVEEKNATPIQNRRILTLQDPRSPSESIHRTPIITDTTDFQDPRSPTAEICRTPVEETGDPRSPTEGIPRTPANPFVFPDPRSPSIGITRTPMIKTIEEREIAQESEDQLAELRRRKVEHSGDSTNETMNNNSNNAEDNRLRDNEDEKEKSNTDDEKDVDTKAEPLEAIDTPQYEAELAKLRLVDENTSKEVQEVSHCATLVLTNSESGVKYRGNTTAKRSLKDNFQASLTQRSRSPLSSRNNVVAKNSPSATATKHQQVGATRPTRLIARYGPAGLDKENV